LGVATEAAAEGKLTSFLFQVNGPVLNIDDKRAIGTRKRYGVAADVIYGLCHLVRNTAT
jgi:hypothetical protein